MAWPACTILFYKYGSGPKEVTTIGRVSTVQLNRAVAVALDRHGRPSLSPRQSCRLSLAFFANLAASQERREEAFFLSVCCSSPLPRVVSACLAHLKGGGRWSSRVLRLEGRGRTGHTTSDIFQPPKVLNMAATGLVGFSRSLFQPYLTVDFHNWGCTVHTRVDVGTCWCQSSSIELSRKLKKKGLGFEVIFCTYLLYLSNSFLYFVW